MTQAAVTHTDSGRDLTQSSGHFAPRIFNQSAADPVSAFYHQTAAAAARLILTYAPTEVPPLTEFVDKLDRGQNERFDLPAGGGFSDADAAALAGALIQRRLRLPISEVDLGSDL